MSWIIFKGDMSQFLIFNFKILIIFVSLHDF